VLKELKETMPKELNEKMIISHETENTDEEREITRKN
jgi:hypothetical protein